jgi:hypothetical protein
LTNATANVATDTAIGTGEKNTIAIIVAQGGIAPSYAAGVARAYKGGGFDDWFLPSKEELNQMYLKKGAINTTAVVNGGYDFLNDEYWSSTQVSVLSEYYARTQDFLEGARKVRDKNLDHRVRAVRAF